MKANKNICIAVIILFVGSIFNLNAQYKKETGGLPDEVMAWTKSTLNLRSLKRYKSLKDAMIDNNFYLPKVFNGGIFPKLDFGDPVSNIYDLKIDNKYLPSVTPFGEKEKKNLFRSYLLKKSLEENAYKNVLLKRPEYFSYNYKQLPGSTIKPENIEKAVQGVKVNVAAINVTSDPVGSELKFIPDRKYWISSFSADLKFSQNKSSDNWVSGKIDNMNIYENIIVGYNYAKDRITLTNTLSNTLTVNNAPNDTVHFYTLGSNELRFKSNFGLKAIGKWSYSASGEFVTPILSKFLPNSKKINSTILSPYTINIGLGMTFAKKYIYKRPNNDWDIQLSLDPLAFKYMYSVNKEIQLGAYFTKDKDGTIPYVYRSFGSKFTSTGTYRFNKFMDLWTRAYYFTSYERITAELENKLSIALNRYFSTMFYLYLRYDDGVAKSPKSDTYLQVNEMFTFGFKYQW
jgi:hypothetical protein